MKKILIVDDQPEIRDLLTVTLRIGPYHLLQAANGPEAIELAQQERPHLILLDVAMGQGKMNGFEVCRQLKACHMTWDSFVIMMSGRGQKREVQQGYAAGANDYVVKPFSPLQLMTKVDAVMD